MLVSTLSPACLMSHTAVRDSSVRLVMNDAVKDRPGDDDDCRDGRRLRCSRDRSVKCWVSVFSYE